MGPRTRSVFTILVLSLWGYDQSLTKSPVPSRPRRSPVPTGDTTGDTPRCSYTFLVPEQKITGPICAARGGGTTAVKDRVTRLDVASVRDAVSRQRRLVDALKLAVDVDGHLVDEVKLLRKESRNMNSRVTQLYMQLLHEIIRKRDTSLEQAALEARVLNASNESLHLTARYRRLENQYAALAALVNQQALLIAALEERCPEGYRYGYEAPPPAEGSPLVEVVPENIPVNVPRFTNEIQRENPRGFPRERGSRSGPSPTSGALELQHRNFSSKGPFRDCLAAQEAGYSTSGVYLIRPDELERPISAWCEQDIDGGGWTVIQSRRDGSVNFFRNWDSYKGGFGSVAGDYWLGLEGIYRLGRQADYRLQVELADWTDKKVYAQYGSFHLEPESQGYRLRLGTYQGNAGDSLSSHNGKQFTTLDRDKDAFSGNCAHFHKGGWWYNACGQANLNGVWYAGGVYRSKFQDGMFWADYGGGFYSMKSVRMLIRPID